MNEVIAIVELSAKSLATWVKRLLVICVVYDANTLDDCFFWLEWVRNLPLLSV
jgi:hypothetical protein